MLIKIRWLAAALIILLAASAGSLYWYLYGTQTPLSALFEKPLHCDLLIKNGTVADGSGGKLYKADIAVVDDKIVRVGEFRAMADQIINAEGLIAAPGFINPHSHTDQTIINDPDARASLLQGVTTEIVGLDGLSSVNMEKHYAEVSLQGIGINYGSLVGQGSIRQAVMGNSSRPATKEEIASMQTLVKKAMDQGAFGLSTGLEYIPGVYTPTEEIIKLATAVTPYKGVYVSHIRNERDNVVGAVKEALEIGRSAGIPAVISHIKVGSSIYDSTREKIITRNTEEVIKVIGDYRERGGKVFADIYPYRVSWFQINKRPEQAVWTYPVNTILVSAASNKSYIGKTITEIAAAQKASPGLITQQLIADPLALVCVQNLSEASLRSFLKTPFSVIGMDNAVYWGDPSYIPPAHPRNFGTYPRVLGEYVRENNILTLEEAVHKMTGLTAEIYGINKRGLIRESYFADLVVFEPEIIKDRATYWKPNIPPVGINFVIVNGKVAAVNGKCVYQDNVSAKGIRAGKILRH